MAGTGHTFGLLLVQLMQFKFNSLKQEYNYLLAILCSPDKQFGPCSRTKNFLNRILNVAEMTFI